MLFITKNIISFINWKLISPFPRHVFKIYLRLIMLHENKSYPYLAKGIFASVLQPKLHFLLYQAFCVSVAKCKDIKVAVLRF